MKALKTILAGGTAMATLAIATPASAQYFPGYGYGGGGDVIGQVIGGIFGGGVYGSPYGGGYGSPYGGGYGSPYGGYAQAYGYGSPYGYGNRGASANQYAVGVCMGAVQQRLDAGYARSQYSGGARVLGVSDVERRSNGGTLVSGVANSGRGGGGTYGYNGGRSPVDLTFTCKTDASGRVSSIEIGQATPVTNAYPAYPGYQGNPVQSSPYAQDYSQYGYRRY